MAQNVTFVYKALSSTRALNYHVAKVIAEGVYSGLEIKATDPTSMKLDITEGMAFTNEGVKIEETLPQVNIVEIAPPETNAIRKDLVVLRHRYKVPANATEEPNIATYHVIKGIPAPTYNAAFAPDEYVPTEGEILPGDWLREGDIPLAEIIVTPGMSSIANNNILNRVRTQTSTGLANLVAESLFLSLGNFVYKGWDLTASVLNVIVSPGEGLIGGRRTVTEDSSLITTLRAREYLYGPNGENGAPYLVGENLTLEKQPDYPSKLQITVTPRGNGTSGYIYVTGENEHGEVIDNEAIYVDAPNYDEPVTVETLSAFRTVYHEGIDAHELERAGMSHEIYIKDKPVAHLFAVGTSAGTATFKAVYDPAYQSTRNEYLIGWAETDELEIIELYKWSTDVSSEVLDNISEQCNGSKRVFTLKGVPRDNSEIVILDGLILMKNSPNLKGYTLVNNTITLQANVPTPDGPGAVHGSAGSDFWVKYRRIS